MSIEDVIDNDTKLVEHSLMLEKMSDTYDTLMERMASLERLIKSACIDYIEANPETKSSMEKIELHAVILNKRHRGEYEELTALRIVIKKHEKRMEIVDRLMGAVQSRIKNMPNTGKY